MPVLITSRKSSADRSHAPDDDRNAADGTKISRPVGFRRNFMRDSFNSGRRRRPPRRRQEPDLVTENIAGSRARRQHWVPAPCLSHKKDCQNNRASFPLCLVCDHRSLKSPQEGNVEMLAKRLEADFHLIKELSHQVDKKGRRQRIKVLKDLCELDTGSTGQQLRRWQEILQAAAEEGKKATLATKSPDGPRRKEHAKKQKTFFRPIMPQSSVMKAEVHRTHSEGQSIVEKNCNLSSSVSAKVPVKEKEKIPGRDNKKKRKTKLLARENSSKDLIRECMERIEVSKEKFVQAEDSGEETDVSVTFSSPDIKNSLSEKKPKKNGKNRSKEGQGPSATNDGDFFAELVIDELKRENAELKFSLLTRDEQLKKAAEEIHQLVEDKSRLAKRLDKTVLRAQQQAEEMAQEINFKEGDNKAQMQKLQARIQELIVVEDATADTLNKKNEEAETVRILTSKLRESEDKNAELMTYIRKLNESYIAAFGNADTTSSLSQVEMLDGVHKAP